MITLSKMLAHVSFVDIFNLCVFLTFTICYAYQLVYVFVGLLTRPKLPTAKKNHKFAVFISARNESTVIGNLIHSILKQNYPSELIDIYVIADNCTDHTAQIARDCGAFVIERQNKELIGKGFALNYGMNIVMRECMNTDLGPSICQTADKGVILSPENREIVKNADYDAFFIFDADNVLDSGYFAAMNRLYDKGFTVGTSYRNTKNFDSNWISAGYAT